VIHNCLYSPYTPLQKVLNFFSRCLSASDVKVIKKNNYLLTTALTSEPSWHSVLIPFIRVVTTEQDHVIHCFVVTKKYFFGHQYLLILCSGLLSFTMSIYSMSDWKWHNAELRNVNFSPHTVRVIQRFLTFLPWENS
jgi:hypothetical protein